jgi:ribosome maturation factor RimP
VSTFALRSALPDNFQDCGEELIRKVGESCGIETKEELTVEWKTGKIIVTVHGNTFVSNPDESSGSDGDEENTGNEEKSEDSTGIDITKLAKSINFAFGEDEVGNAIAETHEFEVTTPGASDELSGKMFESYKGFEVICRFEDPKKKKVTEIQGRLHDRNDEITVINIKGRMKKIKNESIEFVKLPKAKKEKGGK